MASDSESSQNDEWTCPICFYRILPTDYAVIEQDSKRKYHPDCLKAWINTNPIGPIQRKDVEEYTIFNMPNKQTIYVGQPPTTEVLPNNTNNDTCSPSQSQIAIGICAGIVVTGVICVLVSFLIVMVLRQ